MRGQRVAMVFDLAFEARLAEGLKSAAMGASFRPGSEAMLEGLAQGFAGKPGSNPGWYFLRAGWVPVGWTPGGHGRNPLRALRLAPEDFGEPVSARAQLSLLEALGG